MVMAIICAGFNSIDPIEGTETIEIDHGRDRVERGFNSIDPIEGTETRLHPLALRGLRRLQ